MPCPDDKILLFVKLSRGFVCLFTCGREHSLLSGKLAPVFSGVIKTGIIFIGNPLNSAETNGNLKIRTLSGENMQLLGIARELDQ